LVPLYFTEIEIAPPEIPLIVFKSAAEIIDPLPLSTPFNPDTEIVYEEIENFPFDGLNGTLSPYLTSS
jgi:hypothetical protein